MKNILIFLSTLVTILCCSVDNKLSMTKRTSSMMDGDILPEWFLTQPELNIGDPLSAINFISLPVPFRPQVVYEESPYVSVILFFNNVSAPGTIPQITEVTKIKRRGPTGTSSYQCIKIGKYCKTIYLSTEDVNTPTKLVGLPYNRFFAIKKNPSLSGEWHKNNLDLEKIYTLSDDSLLKELLLTTQVKMTVDSVNTMATLFQTGTFVYRLYYYYEIDNKFIYKLKVRNETAFLIVQRKPGPTDKLYVLSTTFMTLDAAIAAIRTPGLECDLYLAERPSAGESTKKRKQRDTDKEDPSEASTSKQYRTDQVSVIKHTQDV